MTGVQTCALPISDSAERVKKGAEDLKKVPILLEKLSAYLLIEDFSDRKSVV